MHGDKFDHSPRGEFRGDFSRDSFDPFRHFSRVLMQQGRVQVDADWNEQVSIFLHYMRSLTRDLGGEHWGPKDAGFEIKVKVKTLTIGKGHYYVQGLLCENEKDLTQSAKITDGENLVYLDVWERHISYVEDNYIREVALGGPDTASREKIMWQVKLKEIDSQDGPNFKEDYDAFLAELVQKIKPGKGELRARAKQVEEKNKNPCIVSPESRYRGLENQLYRVEIHKEGVAGEATFKWSRENGSVIFSIVKTSGNVVSLVHLGQDDRFSLKPNDWVEIVDDESSMRDLRGTLWQVEQVDREKMEVTLKNAEGGSSLPVFSENTESHPYLRRWDQKKGNSEGIMVEGNAEWLMLEDGVQIQFPDHENEKHYHSGDYWLIPARTATGDVEWPGPPDNPTSLTPHGVIHHYAPLQLITVDNGEVRVANNKDCRRTLNKMWRK